MVPKVLSWLLTTVLLTTAPSADAQQSKKIYRIGYLSAGDAKSDSERSEAFRLALGKLGYIEGQNIAIEFRYTGTKPTQAALASELVGLSPDIIVAAGGDVLIRAAKNATKTIPIVMIGVGSDPVRANLIESLARPGGNVTGLTNFNRELGGKRLELLKETVPKLNDVVVLYDPRSPGIALEVKEFLPDVARGLGLSTRSLQLRDGNNFEKVFAALNKDRPDGLYVSGAGSFMRVNRKRIAELALKARFPAVYDNVESVESGGLMYYGADLLDAYRRVAAYVDKLLRGANPADLPVERPTKFELVVNLKTAKQIGLTIPPNVLARADRVLR
jgi:putative ABC transport system substrate-binding protein